MNTPAEHHEAAESRDLVAEQKFISHHLEHNVAPRILALRASGVMGMEDKLGGGKPKDLVTEADGLSERLIAEAIRRRFPKDKIKGEEFGQQGAEQSDDEWDADPIDGTVNFSLGDQCGISVARLHKGQPVVGVIHFLHDNTQLYAAKGHGAFFRNCTTGEEKRIQIPTDEEVRELKKCHLAYDRGYGDVDEQLQAFIALHHAAYYATSDACYLTSTRRVLEGKRHAYVNTGPASHDIAASIIIAQEAGAVVSGIRADQLDFEKGEKTVGDLVVIPTIIARNQGILQQIKDVLNKGQRAA